MKDYVVKKINQWLRNFTPAGKEFLPNNTNNNIYCITPVVYQNIYKGALGEECGKFILEDCFKTQLKEIDDPAKFELFDFEFSPGVYIAFKHWRPYYYSDRKKMYRKISKKLDECGGKRVYIINIFADGFLNPDEIEDSRIIVIPNLLNEEDNSINFNAIKAIHTEDISGGKINEDK